MEYRVSLDVNINEKKGTNEDFIDSKVNNNNDRDRESSDSLKEVSDRREASADDDKNDGKTGKAALKTMATKLLKDTSINAINYAYDNTIQQYMYNGNTAKANQMNNLKTNITGAVGFGSAIVSGAMMGSALGPYGAAAGAVVALVTESVQLAMDYNSATMKMFYKFQQLGLDAEKNQRRLGIQGSKRNREGSGIYKL